VPGIIFIILAFMLGAMNGVFRRVPNQKSVVGEIVSIEREEPLESEGTMYTAYVEYYVNGVPYAIKTKYKSSTFRTGQKMRVVYDEMVPNHAIVRPKVIVYIIMAAFFIAGILICYLMPFK